MNIMNRLIYCKRKKERKNSNRQQQQLILFTKICGWGWRLTTQSLSTLAHQTRRGLLTSVQSSHLKDAAYFIAVSVTSSWDGTQEELVTDYNRRTKTHHRKTLSSKLVNW